MTQQQVIAILKEKGYSYLGGNFYCDIYENRDSEIYQVKVESDGSVYYYYSHTDGVPLDYFIIEHPTPELLRQIL